MEETHLLLIAMGVAIAAGVTQGITGFGFVMVAAPVLSAIADPKLVVPVMILQTSVTNVLILAHAWRHLRLRGVWPLLAAGAVGAPAGAVALVFLDSSVLRLSIGLIVGVTALAMLAGFQRTVNNERVASVPVGFASGALNSSTGLAAPPVVLFFANQNVESSQFRANIAAHFTVLNLVTVPAFVLGGLFTPEALRLGFGLMPATVIGVGAGIIISRWVHGQAFRRLALVLVLFAGGGAIAAAFTGSI
ncbi:MAG: sulfite exporter TauE/SafE family protein [Dehalococcoidia bacterium]